MILSIIIHDIRIQQFIIQNINWMDAQLKYKKMSFLETMAKQNLQMLIKVSKFKQFSQLDYLLQDLIGKKYRIKIDHQIQCTCHIGNLGHCPHSLYILLRIYQIHQNDPILYKDSYTDQQLNQIKSKAKTITNHTTNRIKEKQITIKDTTQQKQWPKFQKDTVCPICYDQIENGVAIINCCNCHNYFHTKCLKVWVISKKNQQTGDNNSCPMCRSQFQVDIETRLIEEEKFYVKYHQSHEINCFECHQEILIKRYRCLLCLNTDLCQKCYFGWQHKSHDKFIGKLSKRGQWLVTTRSQFNMQRLNASVEYMKKLNGQQDIKQMMGEKYKQFLDSYIKKPTLLQHLMDSLMDVEKQVHKKFKKLEFHQKDVVCCMCKKKKIVGMRRMQCEHFIDEKCLKFILKKGVRVCPIDKNSILFGLTGLDLKIN